MKLELGKRIMLELVERKYEDTKSSKIRIDENDFLGQKIRNEAYSQDEIVDILLALEKSTKGKIKLLSVTSKNDQPEDYRGSIKETEDRMFEIQKRYPNYFYITYEPLAVVMNKKGVEETLLLSRGKGLCRVIDGKTVCYPIQKQRYEIISCLGKRFLSTKDLAEQIGERDIQKIRSQIGSMRKQIEKQLSLNGILVIESSPTGEGYKIGNKIKIIKA